MRTIQIVNETDDTPGDFGRIAAMTAKQVIMSRLRDAEQETTYGEYAGREGDLVSGLVQHHSGRPPGRPGLRPPRRHRRRAAAVGAGSG